jgi:hypothetical protein
VSQALPFGDVLEAADRLTPDEQHDLIAILNRRLAQAARQRVAADIQEARQEFAAGRRTPATADEIMREILQ